MTSTSAADAFLTKINDLFTGLGDLRYGEDVTQMEHALQTAHQAKLDDASPALIAAALLHDIGHLMQKIGEDAAAPTATSGPALDKRRGPNRRPKTQRRHRSRGRRLG